ncbi:MAG: hypothetical protein QOH60_2154 [Mycobacterium sp.]|jgi:hypothetical protein|nr:hypothetical protein [Mycobacterium sp.]
MTTTGRSSAFAILGCATIAIAGGFAVGATPAHAFPMVPHDPPPSANCAQYEFSGFVRFLIPATNEELNFAAMTTKSSYYGPAKLDSSAGNASANITGRDVYLLDQR